MLITRLTCVPTHSVTGIHVSTAVVFSAKQRTAATDASCSQVRTVS